jgi:hypothetical protein
VLKLAELIRQEAPPSMYTDEAESRKLPAMVTVPPRVAAELTEVMMAGLLNENEGDC